MIPSKIVKRIDKPTPNLFSDFPDSPQSKKIQNTLLLVSKTSNLPQQFQKSEKMKTTGNKNESLRHSKNNSMTHISTSENSKVTDSIHNVLSIYNNRNEENQLKLEMKLKSQIISDLTKKVQQLEQQNVNCKEMISSLEKDIKTLNQTIEKMCEQLQLKAEQFNTQREELESVMKQLQKRDRQMISSKQENQQLLDIIKKGTYERSKEDKENIITVNSKVQQEQIIKLKAQIEKQRHEFNEKETEMSRQIQGLNKFLSEIVQTQTSDNNLCSFGNSSRRSNKDQIHRKQSLQYEMETFQQQLERIEMEKTKCDEKLSNMQTTLNLLTEKQLITIDNLDTKELTKLKQVVQIQKKQIELQSKTILNQHFEIQNLQTLLYQTDNNCEEKQEQKDSLRRERAKYSINTNEFNVSPKEEVYHLNDSQSDIKSKYYFESQQNTFQKYQVITEESTFRN